MKSKNMNKWFHARDDKEMEYDSIGKFGNITFKGLGNLTVHVITEKYSGGKLHHFIKDDFTIRYNGNFQDDIMQDIQEYTDIKFHLMSYTPIKPILISFGTRRQTTTMK